MVRVPYRGVGEAARRAKEDEMEPTVKERRDWAAELRVRAEGEHIVVVAEGEDGLCEVRLTFAETERFEEALDKVRKRVGLKVEARRSREATRVDRVEEDEEELE